MSTLKDKTVQKEKAIKEIIETEKKFLQNIEDLRHYYLNPLKKCNLFSEHVIATFESNFDEIIFVSTELYEQLCFQKNQNHGFCFVALQQPFLKAYTKYHLNYDYMTELLRGELKTNPDFYEKLDELYKKNPSNLTMASYLIMPIQRIPKIITLLKEVLKNTEESHGDYLNLKEAIQVVESVTESINTSLKESKKIQEVESVKNEKRFVTIEIKGEEVMFNFEVYGVSYYLTSIGKQAFDYSKRKFYEKDSSPHDLTVLIGEKACTLSIQIPGYEIKEDKAYYIVKVTCKIGESQVKTWSLAKRFNTFAELHEKYKEEVKQTSKFAVLPPKRPEILVNHLDEDFLHQRRADLELYLNTMVSQEVYPCLIQFLDIQHSPVASYFNKELNQLKK